MVTNLLPRGPMNCNDSLALPTRPPTSMLNMDWVLPLLGRKVRDDEAVVEVDLMARSAEAEAMIRVEVALAEVVPMAALLETSNLITSVPPVENPRISAPAEKMPVLVSPEKV